VIARKLAAREEHITTSVGVRSGRRTVLSQNVVGIGSSGGTELKENADVRKRSISESRKI